MPTLLESEKYTVIAADTIESALSHLSQADVFGLVVESRIDRFPTLEVSRQFKRVFSEGYVMMLTYIEVQAEEYVKTIEAGSVD